MEETKSTRKSLCVYISIENTVYFICARRQDHELTAAGTHILGLSPCQIWIIYQIWNTFTRAVYREPHQLFPTQRQSPLAKLCHLQTKPLSSSYREIRTISGFSGASYPCECWTRILPPLLFRQTQRLVRVNGLNCLCVTLTRYDDFRWLNWATLNVASAVKK